MTRSDIIEALSPLDDIITTDGSCHWTDVANARDEIQRRLLAIPGLSFVIAGEAVIVPKEAPVAAVKKGMAYYGTDADKEALGAFLHGWDIALSASPYAVEKNYG